ncbi:hypothetical protein OU798_09465 [Prolixibacteraceae bacterium Z1-6]|uniref:Uncharacterized protein n=1 Tax=Draconibacterium aestuarii TaxID=2998507 RepID=A0A9X3J4L8_9BACT|nr:hypothetical protein [Prolixibacteraceae bacterium Z1-6]
MKKVVHFPGLICKKETLEPIKTNTLENTIVSEATSPYANYYGELPRKAKPNSIFLFTTRFYFLEEILGCAKSIESCSLDAVNIASATVDYRNKQYPAIRIKNFPDYKELVTLQKCMAEQGIKFLNNFHLDGEVNVKINKLFTLEELGNGYYIDLVEENKGYFTHPSRISCDDFQQIIRQVKNNGNCKLFDAVHGEILMEGKLIELVRVFSEGLNQELLECIKKEFDRNR